MHFLPSLLAFVAGFLLCCMSIPSVRKCVIAVEDTLGVHEAGLSRVASRVPVRENGPQNMAQLIMLRHKINQTNSRRRRSVSHSRQASRSFAIPSSRPHRNPFARFGRAFVGKHYH
ncbi:hypothetical protein PUNSTDRAFT_112327 [Punctularia strigosozonata HHB-11173 SS5]|uniref:uncharacterized protein n=1 Tax=Punctularia strigosozonata (strain HHB-11173) TaxID=741275 RepID=UPI000441643D|nr:uncharacterized protein PUNSTDRAFT_112327 [Punctularia strigosozonata HHB-11173 SS5]EIN10479.1 hypothetical protein PUNSTDRAFT_112327 [Punctularia strigosozonata HHB-11173 SS5]